MARELVVMWVGREGKGPWSELCRDYRERLERWATVRDVAVRPRGSADRREEAERRQLEMEAIVSALPDPCALVALDARGRARSSESFSSWLSQKQESYPHPIVFLVGSDAGLDPRLRRRAELQLSFGPMTLPHELARLVLYEQLYRALAIQHGIKYHRDPF